MELSHVFHVPENHIRVVSPDVGGGFGLKGGPFPDDVLTLWASRKLAPAGEMARHPQREHAQRPSRPRDGLLRRARARRARQDPRAARRRCLFQIGAYFVGPALAAGAFSIRFVPEAYDIQTMHIMSQGLFTNTSQSGPYRGAGRPEAAYFMERLIEHAAREIGMDPAEIRRRNLIPPSKLPYATPTLVDLRQRRVRAPARQVHRVTATGRATRRARRRPRTTASCAAAR